MTEIEIVVKMKVALDDGSTELQKVAGREIIAGINTSIDHNANVEDLEVTYIESTEVTVKKTNLMPDEEINALG